MIPKKKQYKGWTLPSKYTFWGAIIGLICLIIAIGQIKSCALQNKEDKKKDREEARSGLLENKNDSNYNEFEITVGGFTSIYEKQQFLDGLEISKLFVCNDVEPITIKLLKGNITLNSKFYNLDNEIVGEIENNEWQLNNNYYKRNYDDKAIEVIDNYDVVVMQIEWKIIKL